MEALIALDVVLKDGRHLKITNCDELANPEEKGYCNRNFTCGFRADPDGCDVVVYDEQMIDVIGPEWVEANITVDVLKDCGFEPGIYYFGPGRIKGYRQQSQEFSYKRTDVQ